MTGKPGELTDEQLACLAGARSEFFEDLARRHQAAVFALILRLVRNRDDALELAQDSFLKAFQHLSQYDPAQCFKNWLMTIAMNTALNHLDASRVRRTVPWAAAAREGIQSAAAPDSPLAQAGRNELLEMIERALAQLPDKARAIFVLYYQQSLSCQEISRMLGESVSNVKVSLLRSRRRLRRELALDE